MKRIIPLLLSVILAVGMTVAASAAGNPKIKEQISALSDVDVGECSPGQEIWLPLVKDAFDGATEDLKMSDVKSGKITAKQTARTGSKAIDTVEIKENSKKVACVLVTLVDPFTSTKELDFETKIELYINGKRQGMPAVVTGTLMNNLEDVYSDTDYVDLSDGRTAQCLENARKVEAYIGEGISVFVNMMKNKEYYGTVSREPDDDDYEVFDKYPDVSEVLALTTIGMNAEGKTVKLDLDKNYHVYSKNLDYLGRANDMLPYSTKYYLAAKQLDTDESEPEPESEPESDGSDTDDLPEETSAPAGEDEPADSSSEPEDSRPHQTKPANGNPDTGVPPLLNLSLMGGAISLGALTVVFANKKQ